MKRPLFLTVLLLVSMATLAQLGDFQPGRRSRQPARRNFVTIAADPGLEGGPLKNLLLGKNYRKEWLQPVRVPVLDFDRDFNGAAVRKEGGGRQTRSLHIEDKTGRRWVLRSVRKFPENALRPSMQGTLAERIVANGVSASFPYGVLSVGTLAKAAGAPYLPNTLVFIPDHPLLRDVDPQFKNTLAFLEQRTADTAAGHQKTWDTYELVPRLLQSGLNTVAQVEVLKARLLDNFIMDFDRHDDQWSWLKRDSGAYAVYYPVPKDRDQAFFRIRGLLPKLARFIQPGLAQLQGLRPKTAQVEMFNFVAKDFDRNFLNELDETTWRREIDAFLLAINDSVIEQALRRQPDSVESHQVTDIIAILKEKRQHFKADMLTYYRALSRRVSIAASNGDDHITAASDSTGQTMITIEQWQPESKRFYATYQRTFSPGVTKELHIHGLEGKDRFIVAGVPSRIKLRLVGGPGEDHFIDESGGGKVFAYDVSFEKNHLSGTSIRRRINSDPLNNEYQRLGFQYRTALPGVGLELTREGGLFIGPTYQLTVPGFRKDPFAAQHYFYVTRAISSPSYHLMYNADFISVARQTDLVIRSDASLPVVQSYFFGLGNNSAYDQKLGWRYYTAQYHRIDATVQARFRSSSWLQFSAGPVFQYLKLPEARNKDAFVSTVLPAGEDGDPLYRGMFYGGVEIRAEANRRNQPVLPTRGLHAVAYARTLQGLGAGGSAFQQVGGSFSVFTDFLWQRRLVLASSVGADQNFGDYQFPQAQYLGFRQNLRGFNFQRFAGDGRAYNNTELRLDFGRRNLYLLKAVVGLVAFHDVGRVWVRNEKSTRWHRGWGGGVWLAPTNNIVLTGIVAWSREEKARQQLSVGFQF